MNNLFAELRTDVPGELVEILINDNHVRIERIVSTGQASPNGFWYDQEEAEWVVLLKGAAKLLFEGDQKPIQMKLGDYVTIPAHNKHRVVWTSTDEPAVWLAVFYKHDDSDGPVDKVS